jgi:hypothetical protein
MNFFYSNDKYHEYAGTMVEVLQKISETETKVRFHDGKVVIVNSSNLYAPELVPFKVGDKIRNIKGFVHTSGAWIGSGITWEIKSVTYNPPKFDFAIIECYSSEIAVGECFHSKQVEKI